MKTRNKKEIQIETNKNILIEKDIMPGILITPAINPDYWLFRIPLSDKQALVAFPKFGIIGIGFQYEIDWNTNLPSNCDALEIYNHIKDNKQDTSITRKECIDAIKALQIIIKKMVLNFI